MMDRLRNYWKDSRTLSPARAVLHPAWILAVAILVVNDHVLKPAAFAEPLTGKLSDFAGLFFAPVLLAAILGVKSRRGLWLAGLATGTVFAAINLSPALAALWDSAVSLLIGFQTTPDPTDLMALLAIPVGIVLLEPVMRRDNPTTTRRMVEIAAITIGGISSMATSPVCRGDECNFVPEQSGQVSVLNKTNELHILRVRSLRPNVMLDCDQVAEDPNAYLRDGVFGPPETWFLQSGQEIPIGPVTFNEWGEAVRQESGRCRAMLIQSDTTPDIIAFWGSELRTKSFPFDADIPPEIPADPQTIVLDADYSRATPDQMHPWRNRGECGERADLCSDELLEPLAEIPDGTRYFWRSVFDEPLHFTRPAVNRGSADASPQCKLPGPGDGLAWERPPQGDRVVVELSPGIDGCHELQLAASLEDAEELGSSGSWWLCTPFDAIEFLAPTEETVTRIAVSPENQQGDFSRGGYEGLRIDATRLPRTDVPGTEFRKMYFIRGYGVPEDVNFGFDVALRDDCEPAEVACGQTALPVDVLLTEYGEQVTPGESITVGDVVPLEVHVARAEYRPVLDTACEAEEASEPDRIPVSTENRVGYIEAVIIAQ